MTPTDPPPRRDPEGRRRTIVVAAAELIVEGGVAALTHRRIAARAGVPLGSTTYYFATLDELAAAALDVLAQQVDASIADVRQSLAAEGATPDALARLFDEYLRDRERVQTEGALYAAGIQREELRPFTLRWFDGLVAALASHVGPGRARAIAIYADGALIQAALRGEPVPLAESRAVVAALLAVDDAAFGEDGR